MPILSFGIFLPNGRFLPNQGDGHTKNAIRFCNNYPILDQLRISEKNMNADDFIITAGCAIVASYCGKRCIKVAENNENSIINNLVIEYKEAGYEIWKYWNIDATYKAAMEEKKKKMNQMILTKRSD